MIPPLVHARQKPESVTVAPSKVEVLPSSSLPASVAPGRILIDVLQRGGPERYWHYEVRPQTASVSCVRDETFRDSQHENIVHGYHQPTGAIETCRKTPNATSPDRKYVAGCRFLVVPDGQFARKYLPVFFIADAATSKELFVWQMKESLVIRGFSWSPTSQAVAVLDHSEFYGKSAIEKLSAAAGHPVPHATVYLHVIPLATMKPVEFLIRKDVTYAFERILNWSTD
jgi:hypothetical protein